MVRNCTELSGIVHILITHMHARTHARTYTYPYFKPDQRLRYVVHGLGCNPHRSLWCHWWRHNWETIRDRQKRRSPRPMKSSELCNGENRIALQQLLQNRKWRHLRRHNLGSRRKLQKMTRENFSIGAFYNITKNQDNPIKTVGRDSFWAPKPLQYKFF